MKINNCFEKQPCTMGEQAVEVFSDGREARTEVLQAREHQLSVLINETPAMELVCTPELLAELVLGRLLTEGIITGTVDVERLYICEQGAHCRVFLTPSAPGLRPAVATVPSCCTGNRVFLCPEEMPACPKAAPYRWKREWITALARVFADGTPFHRATRGTHSCMLAREDVPLYRCEDLGRHNALDKAVGCALRDGEDLSRTILCTSGRIPVDMLMKAIRAGVPVLVSNAVPTEQAVSLARQHGITLICRARPEQFLVFSGADGMDAPKQF